MLVVAKLDTQVTTWTEQEDHGKEKEADHTFLERLSFISL